MRYRTHWMCLILLGLLATLGTIILAEDMPNWQVFLQTKDYSVPADDKEDTLYKLRIDYARSDGQLDTAVGSATNIGNDELLTADHCVDIGIAREIFIRTNDGWMQCDVLAKDDDYDIALLHCRTHLPAAPLQLDETEHTKGIAHVYGCPWGGKKQRFEGILQDPSAKGYIHSPMLECMQVTPGCSGGPVVYEHKIIGMEQAIKQKGDGGNTGKAYYLSSKTILEWLKEVRSELEKKKDGNKGAAKPKDGK